MIFFVSFFIKTTGYGYEYGVKDPEADLDFGHKVKNTPGKFYDTTVGTYYVKAAYNKAEFT